jgi:hypothetical protein
VLKKVDFNLKADRMYPLTLVLVRYLFMKSTKLCQIIAHVEVDKFLTNIEVLSIQFDSGVGDKK